MDNNGFPQQEICFCRGIPAAVILDVAAKSRYSDGFGTP
jgi:hypothetical protein